VPPTRPGAGIFTIEGRQAPALFVVGWLGTILGGGIAVVGLLSGGGITGAVLLLGGLALLSIGLVAGAGSQAIERRVHAASDYVGPSPFLVFAAAIPLTVLFQAVIGIPLIGLGLDPDSPVAALLGLLVTAAVYLGLVRLLVVGTGALGWRDMGVQWPGLSAALPELVYGGVLGIALVFGTGLLALLLSQVLALPSSPLPAAGGLGGAIINVISAAIVAPIAEEIFFRGFSTTAWWRAYSAHRAIIQGALFFAAAHVLTVGGDSFQEGAERALFAFLVRVPVALALGWVFVRRRSLLAAIGLHSAFNGLPVLAVLFGAS
jgi:membrane protease YdiL (CAAX protease family)